MVHSVHSNNEDGPLRYELYKHMIHVANCKSLQVILVLNQPSDHVLDIVELRK
jgi:hypothetical protein